LYNSKTYFWLINKNQKDLFMLNRLLALSCSTLFLLSGCQKDLQTKPTALNSSNELSDQAVAAGTQVVDTTNKWYVSYAGYAEPYPTYTDGSFIKDGVAKAPLLSKNFEYSNLSYDIPSKYNISGDSITFEVSVKNKMAGSKSGYDVVLQLFGEQHNAELHFVGVQSGLPYTQYIVGNARRTNLQQLVHYFDHFETVRLIMKNNYTSVYLDSVEVYKFKYGAQNSIGRLKKINVAGKGYAVVNNVNVRNSFGRKMIFNEAFNIDGQSHVVYYP
jgi:hypothetical protein